jgi:hypothetical protein
MAPRQGRCGIERWNAAFDKKPCRVLRARVIEINQSSSTSRYSRGEFDKDRNNKSAPLVFEGNGLFVGEVLVPAGVAQRLELPERTGGID